MIDRKELFRIKPSFPVDDQRWRIDKQAASVFAKGSRSGLVVGNTSENYIRDRDCCMRRSTFLYVGYGIIERSGSRTYAVRRRSDLVENLPV